MGTQRKKRAPRRAGRMVRWAGMLTLAALATLCTSQAADWPCWRGAEGNGVSRESAWNPAALTDDAKPAWKTNIGAGYSAPSVVGEHLFVMGNKENKDTVYCLKTATGEEVWHYTYDCKGGDFPGPRATPAVDGRAVYTFSRDGLALCLNADDGSVTWKKDVRGEMSATPPGWGFAGSPCVDGELLLLNAGAKGIALQKKNGQPVWATTGTGGYSTPVPFTVDSQRCVAIFGQKAFYGLDEKTGAELWSYPWETSYDVNAVDPIFSGKRVLISSGYGKGSALLDFSSGKLELVWQTKTIRSHFSSSVLIDGSVYGIDGNVGRGAVQCIDFTTGAEKWRQETGFGALIAVNGKLIMLNEGGDLIVAEASPAGFKEVSSAKTVISRTCWTAPVFSGGRIYCRNEKGDLVCLDVSK